MIPPRVRWVVRASCVRPEDERQDRALLGSFATLAEADRYVLEQLGEHGPSWGSTMVYREEEVGPRTRRAELSRREGVAVLLRHLPARFQRSFQRRVTTVTPAVDSPAVDSGA